MHHAHVGKLPRLTLLAPDVIEAVLDGRLPKGVRLADLVRPLPADWAGQRRVLRAGGAEQRGGASVGSHRKATRANRADVDGTRAQSR